MSSTCSNSPADNLNPSMMEFLESTVSSLTSCIHGLTHLNGANPIPTVERLVASKGIVVPALAAIQMVLQPSSSKNDDKKARALLRNSQELASTLLLHLIHILNQRLENEGWKWSMYGSKGYSNDGLGDFKKSSDPTIRSIELPIDKTNPARWVWDLLSCLFDSISC